MNAARTIVGDVAADRRGVDRLGRRPRGRRTRPSSRAWREAGGEDALVLTDMFGGTPTNLSLPFLSAKVEIVTGVNLPMLIKASALREGVLAGGGPGGARAGQGRHLRGERDPRPKRRT